MNALMNLASNHSMDPAEVMRAAIDAAQRAMSEIVIDDLYDGIFGTDALDERAVA